jgi:SAM-dependent methyltransferase
VRFPVSQRAREETARRREFFDAVADQFVHPGRFKRYYHGRLARSLGFIIPPGRSVLELGCGVGDLLSDLHPARGVGVDFSEKVVALARKRHPELEFRVGDAHEPEVEERFDFVLLSNLVGDLVDVQRALTGIRKNCHDRTRVVITHFNYFWSPAIKIAERMGMKPRQREQNWLEIEDLENLLSLSGFETITRKRDTLCPVYLPVAADAINDYLAVLPGLSRLSINEIVVARRVDSAGERSYPVSVIVACKDERGNIEELVRTVPRMGSGTELIFVDGHSADGTVEEIERCIADRQTLNPELSDIRVLVQPGTGKGDAVRAGFEEARGDILMILDADITVRSEDLTKFYAALAEGRGEFINGSRLVYPMEQEAMRFLNMLGNHFFGSLFSWLLDQRLTDTLCGTKVLFKKDYEAIKRGRRFFGDFDPFGDFDLLFGAAKQNLKIREVPVRYHDREYGEIKIDRFRHGLLLLQMSALAFKRFKIYRGVERAGDEGAERAGDEGAGSL